MKIVGIFVGFLFMLLVLGLSAQEQPQTTQGPWTLKQCIDYAVEHNINVRQRILEKQDQELNLHTSRYSRLPNLNANLGQDFYFGRGPGRDGVYQDQTQSTSSFTVGTSVPVFSGLRINNKIKANELNLQASIEELNRAKEDLALNITSYFLQVLFNKELLTIAKEQVLLSQEQLKNTEILVRSGKNPESDLYDAKALLAREEVSLTEAANALQLSLLDLSQLLNLEHLEGFDIAMPDMDGMVTDESINLMKPEAVFTQSVQNRPSVKAAELRLQSSERSLKIAKADYYPTLSLGASYSNGYYHTYNLPDGMRNTSFSKQLDQNGSESVGLTLSIPIFSRMVTRNQVKSARVSMENQQLLLDNMRQNLYKEIQQAYYNAVAARDKYFASEKAVEASRLAFKYEEQKYKAGRSTSYQFDDAKTRLTKSLSESAQAKYDFVFRSKILGFYNGKTLE
ncbi:TolC family protein [Odoribacter sp. OttesenSCG-928-A06]|nr:TolC family protein [Odoribacter sp. OttesenSCG-928-A06]